jgi:hypothetical protein
MPSRLHLKRVRNLALLAGVVAVSPVTWREFRQMMAEDAFAKYRYRQPEPDVSIRFEDVDFRQYRGLDLQTFARADVLEVSNDRIRMSMQGIHDGVYRDGDRTFKYTARHADWNSLTKVLDAEGGVRVRSKDMDLTATKVQFDSGPKLLTIPGAFRGKLAGGRLAAHNLRYRTERETFTMGPVEWTGKPPKDLVGGLPVNLQQRSWNFRSEKIERPEGPEVITYIDAVATDGEVIVIAPKIVHNRKTDEFVAGGLKKGDRIQYFSARANVVADHVEVFRKERRAVFTGDVVMLAKPKSEENGKPKVEALPAFQPLQPDEVKAEPPAKGRPEDEKEKDEQLRNNESLRKYPLVMASAKVEYWYERGSRKAVITGNPQGRQELPGDRWRHLWTNIGYYDGEKETLRLVSSKDLKDTRMKNSIGDDVIAEWMLVSTAEDSEAFTGSKIEATFVDLSDEDPRNETKPATPPPATGTGGGGGGGGNPPPRRASA